VADPTSAAAAAAIASSSSDGTVFRARRRDVMLDHGRALDGSNGKSPPGKVKQRRRGRIWLWGVL
jgi:hypothetical protein